MTTTESQAAVSQLPKIEITGQRNQPIPFSILSSRCIIKDLKAKIAGDNGIKDVNDIKISFVEEYNDGNCCIDRGKDCTDEQDISYIEKNRAPDSSFLYINVENWPAEKRKQRDVAIFEGCTVKINMSRLTNDHQKMSVHKFKETIAEQYGILPDNLKIYPAEHFKIAEIADEKKTTMGEINRNVSSGGWEFSIKWNKSAPAEKTEKSSST